MVLSLLLKVSLRDPSLVPDAVDACLGPLRKIIRGPKTYLRPFVEQCITIFSRNPEKGKEAFLEINKVILRSNSHLQNIFLGRASHYSGNNS